MHQPKSIGPVTTTIAIPDPDNGPFTQDIVNILANSAAEFGVPLNKFMAIATCESTLNPNADNGGHAGLFQQAKRYWAGRVAAFNADPINAGKPLPNANIYDPVTNSRVSAYMMRTGKFSDWAQCL